MKEISYFQKKLYLWIPWQAVSILKPMIVLFFFTQNGLCHSNQSRHAVCPNHPYTSLYSCTAMFYSSAPAFLSVTDTCFAHLLPVSLLSNNLQSPINNSMEKAEDYGLCRETNVLVVSVEL